MALASLQCYPLLNSSVSISRPVSTRTPVLKRTRGARKLQRCFCSQYAERQSPDSPQELERLFSNLNQATMKHEPGSVTSAIFLVAGTTVGAGILAIPAVTQEAGFLASAVICIFCWIYMVVTGLLVAEVNVNTMCELGSGGVSLVSMAMRTLGTFGVRTACLAYLFIHYALLVAYVARSSEIITNSLGIPLYELFSWFSLLVNHLAVRLIHLFSPAFVVKMLYPSY